jgi:peptidoglycan/LPS O-acetylase OafA/YrhL
MSLVAAGISAAVVAGSEFAGPSFAYGNILQMLTAGALTAIMSQRYLDKQKIMPAGIVAGLSFFMFLVFLAPILKGGKPRTA